MKLSVNLKATHLCYDAISSEGRMGALERFRGEIRVGRSTIPPTHMEEVVLTSAETETGQVRG